MLVPPAPELAPPLPASSPPAFFGKKLQKKVADKGKQLDALSVSTSEELKAMAAEFFAAAEAELSKLQGRELTLAVRLGDALAHKRMKVKEIVASWAKGPAGTGAIHKMDFRNRVRNLVDEPEVAVIDELFDSLDADGGGSLDTTELSAAMKKLQDEASYVEAVKKDAAVK